MIILCSVFILSIVLFCLYTRSNDYRFKIVVVDKWGHEDPSRCDYRIVIEHKDPKIGFQTWFYDYNSGLWRCTTVDTIQLSSSEIASRFWLLENVRTLDIRQYQLNRLETGFLQAKERQELKCV
jgi:hypothetical protein